MLVVLQAISGGAPGRRVQLRTDQVLKVGRSGWADLPVENDASLEELHFEVRCGSEGCVVRSLDAAAPTLINGQPISTAVAYDGDEIIAGATLFRLTVQGGPERPAPEAADESPAEPVEDAPPAPAAAVDAATLGLAGVCAYLEFTDDVQPLAESAQAPEALIAELIAQEKYDDALRLRAFLLEKRLAVWWGVCCLRERLKNPLPAPQNDAVDAAANWAAEPDESLRRTAEAKAAAAGYAGPGATLALAAFWSDGSLAPEGSPEVEPDERLTSRGVSAALLTAAYQDDPIEAPKLMEAFLERGQEAADGQLKLPE